MSVEASTSSRVPARTGVPTRAVPALVHAGGQVISVLAVQVVALAHGRSGWRWLDSWDGRNFLRVAVHGYSGTMRHGRSPMAFFPGYPAAIAVARWITALSPETAGLVVSCAAGLVTAYGLAALAPQLGLSPRAGTLLIAMVSTGPLSVVFSMVYSEALFCAGVVWTLVLLHRRCWLRAGLLCALTGAIRPTGAALVVALAVAVVVEAARGSRSARPWAALALAPVGLVGYLAWVAVRTGSPTGWFALQARGWGTRFDAGTYTLHRITHVLVSPSLDDVATVVVALTALGLTAVVLADRLPAPVVAYTLVVLAEDLGSAGVWHSKVRLLLPALPLLVPLARRAGALLHDPPPWPAPRRAAVVVAVGVGACAAWVLAGVAYSALVVGFTGRAI